jgi:hypothetical protein
VSAGTTIHENVTSVLSRGRSMGMTGNDDVSLACFRRRNSPSLKSAALVVIADAAHVVIEVHQHVVERREPKTANPATHPHAQFGKPVPTSVTEEKVMMVAVGKEDPSAVGIDQVLFWRGVHIGGDHVVVAVNVRVLATLEARSNLRVGAACATERRRMGQGPPESLVRQGFPNVTEKNNSLEIPLQKVEEAKKLEVPMPETIGQVTMPQMKI